MSGGGLNYDGSKSNALNFDDKLNGKPLSNYYAPKVATKVQKWLKESKEYNNVNIVSKGVLTCGNSVKVEIIFSLWPNLSVQF